MSGLPTRVDRLPDRVLYTAALAAVGLVYPAILALEGALPSLRALAPFLAAGILVGFAVDRLLGDWGLRALTDPTPLAQRFDRLRGDDAQRDSSAGAVGTGGRSHGGGIDDGGGEKAEDDDAEDADADEGDDSGVGWWSLYSLATIGTWSILPFAAPWFAGPLLGLIWMLVAIRLVRLASPFSSGLSRPPRGVPAREIDGPD